jgi:hypothetical protein
MKENETIYISNINNVVLRIIPRGHNFDFHHRSAGIWRPSAKGAGRPGASNYCRRNNFSYEELDVSLRNLKYYQSDLDEENR